MDTIMESKHKNKMFIGSCCGNSFVIVDSFDGELDRKTKVEFSKKNIVRYGVDSALFLNKSNGLDVYMEVFEKDGSESDSCGNGTITTAYLLGLNEGILEMKGGVALISGDSEKLGISMNTKLSLVKGVQGEKKCIFVKMGEPHVIYLVDDIHDFDLLSVGKRMQEKYPAGVNVDALQKTSDDHYLMRTYERGVFAETESCGTGSLSAYVALSYFDDKLHTAPVEFKSAGGSHWVSRNGNMVKLEALRISCKLEEIVGFSKFRAFFSVSDFFSECLQSMTNLPKRFLLKMSSVIIRLK